MKNKELSQYFTPIWAVERIYETFYPDLSADDVVLDACCGDGRFLSALPSEVPCYGVEIDPYWAEQARLNTGREIITGDIQHIDLPWRPTLIVGNPPFMSSVVDAILAKGYSMMEFGGRIGMILPVYMFQTASTVMRYAEKFAISHTLMPRNIFQGLEKPLMFAQFTKAENRTLVGFFLYEETHAIQQLSSKYRYMFIGNDTRSSLWGDVVEHALVALGGEATLQEIYKEVEGRRPTGNAFWRQQIRKVLYSSFVQTGPAQFALHAREAARLGTQFRLAV